VDDGPHEIGAVALAWFPRDELARARERLPALAEELGDADAYCRATELLLRQAAHRFARHPVLAPVTVDALEAYAAEHGVAADSAEAQSGLAAELAGEDAVMAWPPERNAPCWCGSQRKYKRCCGEA
jgi:hypothetical protein